MGIRPLGGWGKITGFCVLVVLFAWATTTVIAETDALSLARAGLAAKERGQYSLAIRLIDRALVQGTLQKQQQGFLFYSRGVSYEELGIHDRAMADFDTTIALLPDFANAYIHRGLIWDERGDYDRAIEEYLRAKRLKPDDPTIFINLGTSYDKRGDVDSAIESYDEAIRLRPDFAAAYFNRAQAHLSKEDKASAIADYGQAISLQPDFSAAYANRGLAHLSLGESDQAISDLSEAVRLSPGDVTLWANRANAFMTIGKYDDALSDFDRALKVDPRNPALYLGRGRVRLFAKHIVGSIEDFKTAVQIAPSNPYSPIWLHIARLHEGRPDQEELSKNAAQIRGSSWPSAVIDYYLGRLDAAQVRAAASEGSPQEKPKRICEVEFYIGEFELYRGEQSKARELLQNVAQRCQAHDVVYGSAVAELSGIGR